MTVYLIDPNKVAEAIGAAYAANRVANDNTQILTVIALMLPRIEDVLNVATLLYGQSTDIFTLKQRPLSSAHRPQMLRLSNGFIESGSIEVRDPDGTLASGYWLNLDQGILTLPAWVNGNYTVTYRSGFKAPPLPDPVPDPLPPQILLDVPEWLRGIVTVLVAKWYRSTILVPKATPGFRFGELTAPLAEELSVRVLNRYQRPRLDVLFTEQYSWSEVA